MAKCKACGAEIVWIKTPKGKFIPCNEGMVPYKASKNGGEVVVTDKGQVVFCFLDFEGQPTGLGRTTHWATCPEAHKFKKEKEP